MDNILSFEKVSFSYKGNSENEKNLGSGEDNMAVREISLNIKRGDFAAVLGHNGSGKSTLAKLSNAILIPDEGRVLVDGMDTADESKCFDIRRLVGMVFQNPDNQIVATVVEEDAAFGPENLGVPQKEIRRRVDEALKAVDMYDYREHEPHRLSGGQKQRVAIAGVIAMHPECIVLDEATAMLDPKGRSEVMKVIRRLHDELKMTVVYITHYMDEAAAADRVIVMEKGRIISDGTPTEVFGDVEKLRSVGLDVPQTTEFSTELRKAGLDISTEILYTADCVDRVADAVKEQRWLY